jgi:hypothetical protein
VAEERKVESLGALKDTAGALYVRLEASHATQSVVRELMVTAKDAMLLLQSDKAFHHVLKDMSADDLRKIATIINSGSRNFEWRTKQIAAVVFGRPLESVAAAERELQSARELLATLTQLLAVKTFAGDNGCIKWEAMGALLLEAVHEAGRKQGEAAGEAEGSTFISRFSGLDT